MTIHANDVVLAIREALRSTTTCESLTSMRCTPNVEQGFPQRDGRIEFDAVGRDWVRAFRITVEAIDVRDVGTDFGDEWDVVA